VKHSLRATPATVHWGHLQADLAPRLQVQSGDHVEIETFSGGRADLGGDLSIVAPAHREIIETVMPMDGPHILTGPIAVEGAKPGDCLEVRIESIRLGADWGYNLIRPGRGTLPEEFHQPRQNTFPIDRSRSVTRLPWGIDVPLRPFFGVLATAPPAEWGRVSSVPPREFGGNIDNKELIAGSSLFLPVFTEGALFSAGDGHAVQGDGEMDVTALETCMDGCFQLILHPGRTLDAPRALTPTHLITMGFDADLDEAARQASHRMLDWLTALTGWSREQAYIFSSLACDIRITQLVNQNKGVHAMVRRDLLNLTEPIAP
jgi:acetamidase/formamidase